MTETIEWTDNHCHLPDDEAEAAAVVVAAKAAGVTRLVDVGTDLDRSKAAIRNAGLFEHVYATVGLHPHDAASGLDGIEDLLATGTAVAVGECGLDYHYDHSPRAVQREAFAAQIAMAHRHELPLVIHSRLAWDDTLDIVRAESVPERTVFHCFTGGPVEARLCLDLGAVLSFSGIVTFKTADELRAAAELCPLDQMMIETDSPYLAPVPNRGKRNQPAWVTVIGAKIAELKNMSVREVAESTHRNAEEFYQLH